VESHVHISLKNNEGRNIFSVSEAELQTGRANAANGDTKYISQEAEWFLAGILDGIADGMFQYCPLTFLRLINSNAQSCLR